MTFKHRRGHFFILFDKLSRIPLLVATVILSYLLFKDFDAESLIAAVFLGFSPLAGIVKYICTFYTIEENHLIIESGVFYKQRTEISLHTVSTVDLSQNILFQLFRVYKIKLDNESQSGGAGDKAEVTLALKAYEAFMFKQIITQYSAVEQRADVVDDREQIIDEIKAGPKEFIKLGLLQSKVTYFIIGGQLSALIIGLISVHITGSNVEDFIDIIVSNVSLWTILIAIFLFYGIALLISVSGSLIKYNNFRLSANNDVLKVEYGLFEKKAFSLRKNKINGVVLEQNLLMRLFRVYSVQVLVIGYGDKSDEEANEQAIIFPIARMDKIKMILQKFLPDFEVNDQLIKSSKKAIKYYFYRFGFVLLLIISVAAFFTKSVPIIVFFSFLIILSVVSKILQYYNSGIYCGKKNVILCFGGYHKNTQIIRTSSIESVRSTGSRFKQKKSITIIGIDFIAPKLKANLTGNNLPLEQYEKLKSVIDY